MKTKLLLSTSGKCEEIWTNLPFIPRISEWFNVSDLLNADELMALVKASKGWSSGKGIVQSVEYRHDDNEFYTEVVVGCEDNLLKK